MEWNNFITKPNFPVSGIIFGDLRAAADNRDFISSKSLMVWDAFNSFRPVFRNLNVSYGFPRFIDIVLNFV